MRPNYFIFIGYLRKKEIESARPHALLYIWTPFPEILDLAACSHVYLLACMQQCACLSGGARSIFVWASVYHFSLCALGQNNGSEACVRAANALITAYVHMLVWVVDVRILAGMHVLQIVQVNSWFHLSIYSCAPILAWYQSIFYTNYCENNTKDLENIYENKDFILFHQYSNPILAFNDQKSTY